MALGSSLHTLVVLLSGDGGWWGDLDAQLGNYLAARGYGVVGVDTSVYFNNERTRSEMSAHVLSLLHSYGRLMKARHVVLIGYSFGANVVPLIYNDLPRTDKALVTDLVLLAPEQTADLEVTLSGRIGIGRGDIDLAPEMQKLPPAATACIYGVEEADQSGCFLPGVRPSSRVALPGSHHFDKDPDHLGRLTVSLIESSERRSTPPHHVGK